MLIDVVPYILGAMISPVLLATAILLLAQKQKPIAKATVFFLGGLLAASIIGSFIFFVAHARTQTSRPTLTDSLIHILVGALLLLLAAKAWRKKKKPTKVSKKVHYSRDFILGFGLMSMNFSSLIMFVPASVELQAASETVKLTALALLISAATLAMWLPILLVIISGQKGRQVLDKLDGFMTRHGQQVSGGVIGLIAVYVLYVGISGL